MREIVLNLEHGAIIPTTIQGRKCPTLIDTGATRSCINEIIFHKLENLETQELHGLRVVSASGEDISLKGMTKLQVTINGNTFEHNFLICRNITKPLIIGLDFLRKYRIGTTWSEKGKFSLQYKNQILIQSIEESFRDERPQIKAKSCIEIPGKSVVVVHGKVAINPEHCDRLFDIIPTAEMITEYPELITVPLVHRTAQKTYNTVPHVLVNLREEMIIIPKGMVLAELQLMTCGINQITTESCYQMSEIQSKENPPEKVSNTTPKEKENIETEEKDDMENLEKKFITSPADVQEHRKADLQDADVSKEERAQFKQLCEEFPEVFSKNSEDIGRTPLVTMEIETGDSPPICQKPYNLALKHVEWVQKELQILEKAGVIERSVSPWASPIVIVPKKSEPGEPPRRRMCVDYRMLNSLLPPVRKAHSKAKGVSSFVPLPTRKPVGFTQSCSSFKRNE